MEAIGSSCSLLNALLSDNAQAPELEWGKVKI
jgi:hypothetical protein